jgi:hypothetical protein
MILFSALAERHFSLKHPSLHTVNLICLFLLCFFYCKNSKIATGWLQVQFHNYCLHFSFEISQLQLSEQSPFMCKKAFDEPGHLTVFRYCISVVINN